MRNKSGFLTFCFAFIPGAGQMYLGYMRRGISMLLALCAAYWLNWFSSVFSVLIAAVWMVSFFDTFNLRSRILGGYAQPDAFLFHLEDWAGMKTILAKRHKLAGWVLIALGVYALYDKFVLGDLYWYLYDNELLSGIWLAVYGILRRVPDIFGCLVLVGVGIWLVKGPRSPKEQDYKEYKPELDPQDDEEA